MCGRFSLFLDAETLQREFNLTAIPADYFPRYNIAPGAPLLVVADAQERRAEWMRWGLIPSWAKDPTIGNRMINARAETLLEKPAFRNAFRHRRCLILGDGFFEWKRDDGKSATPYYFRLVDGRPFAFAGLWESWRAPEGEEVRTCTIITCEPNELIGSIHNRMPVILPPERCYAWLENRDVDEIQALLKPLEANRLTFYEVSKAVNRPENDQPEIIQPLAR